MDKHCEVSLVDTAAHVGVIDNCFLAALRTAGKAEGGKAEGGKERLYTISYPQPQTTQRPIGNDHLYREQSRDK